MKSVSMQIDVRAKRVGPREMLFRCVVSQDDPMGSIAVVIFDRVSVDTRTIARERSLSFHRERKCIERVGFLA
jgi:hypothetical protein